MSSYINPANPRIVRRVSAEASLRSTPAMWVRCDILEGRGLWRFKKKREGKRFYGATPPLSSPSSPPALHPMGIQLSSHRHGTNVWLSRHGGAGQTPATTRGHLAASSRWRHSGNQRHFVDAVRGNNLPPLICSPREWSPPTAARPD